MAPVLKPGDDVRIVAPSGPFDRDAFMEGIDCLKGVGLRPRYDEEIYRKLGYLAGDDATRRHELQAAIDDPTATGLWYARGGYGTTRLLRDIDVTLLLKKPKWVVGFSDATALHSLCFKHGLASMHGPNITTLGGLGEGGRRHLWDFLMKGQGYTIEGAASFGGGLVTAPLWGGNLTVLGALSGTPHLIGAAGCIVFLEDIGEHPYRLDRTLTQLLDAGLFQGALGFAIGQLTACDGEPGALNVITGMLHGAYPDVPMVTGLPIGHESSSLPVPLGRNVILNAQTRTLNVLDLGN